MENKLPVGTVLGYHYAHAVCVVTTPPNILIGQEDKAFVFARMFRDREDGPHDDPPDAPVAMYGCDAVGAVEPDPSRVTYRRALTYAATLRPEGALAWDEAEGEEGKAVPAAEFEAAVARRGVRPFSEGGFASPHASFCRLCARWTGRDVAECGGDFRADCPEGWARFKAEVVTHRGESVRVTPTR